MTPFDYLFLFVLFNEGLCEVVLSLHFLENLILNKGKLYMYNITKMQREGCRELLFF